MHMNQPARSHRRSHAQWMYTHTEKKKKDSREEINSQAAVRMVSEQLGKMAVMQ